MATDADDFIRIEISFLPNPQPACAVPNSVAQLLMLQPAENALASGEPEQLLHVPKKPLVGNLLNQPSISRLRLSNLWEKRMAGPPFQAIESAAFWSYTSVDDGDGGRNSYPASFRRGLGHLYVHLASGRNASDSSGMLDDRVALHKRLVGTGGALDTSMVLRERIGTICVLLKDLRATAAALIETLDEDKPSVSAEAVVQNDRISMQLHNGTADGNFLQGDEEEGTLRIKMTLEMSETSDRRQIIERIMAAIGTEDLDSTPVPCVLIGHSGPLKVHQLLPHWNDHERVQTLSGFARAIAWSNSRTAKEGLGKRRSVLPPPELGQDDLTHAAFVAKAKQLWPVGEDGIRKAPFTHIHGANNSQPYVTMAGGTSVGLPALQIQLAGGASLDQHEELLAKLLDATCQTTVGMTGEQCSDIIHKYLDANERGTLSFPLLRDFTAIASYALPAFLTTLPASATRYKEDFRCSRARGGKATTVEDMFVLLFTHLGGGEDCEDLTAMAMLVEQCLRGGRTGKKLPIGQVVHYGGKDPALVAIHRKLSMDKRFVAVVQNFMPQGVAIFTKRPQLNAWMRLLVGHYLPCQLVLCVGGANPTVQADKNAGAEQEEGKASSATTFKDFLSAMQHNLNNLGNLGWDRKELPTCPHDSTEYMTRRGPDAHQAGALLPLWTCLRRLKQCMDSRPKAWNASPLRSAVNKALVSVGNAGQSDIVLPVLLECTTATTPMAGASMHLRRLAAKVALNVEGHAQVDREVARLESLDAASREHELSLQRRKIRLDSKATGLTTAGKPSIATLLPSDPVLKRTATEFYGCANGLMPGGPIASFALHLLRKGNTSALRALYLMPILPEFASFGVPMERVLEFTPGGMMLGDVLNAIPGIQTLLDSTVSVLSTVVRPCFPLTNPIQTLPAPAVPPFAAAESSAETLYALAKSELNRVQASFDEAELLKSVMSLPWPDKKAVAPDALQLASSRFPLTLHLASLGPVQYRTLATYLRLRENNECIVAMMALRRVNVTAPLAVVLYIGKSA